MILKTKLLFSFIIIPGYLPIIFARLRSVDTFKLRVIFSFDPIGSVGKASYQRGKQVKLIINSIFFSNISRVLSTNKYNEDLSSGKFYSKFNIKIDNDKRNPTVIG